MIVSLLSKDLGIIPIWMGPICLATHGKDTVRKCRLVKDYDVHLEKMWHDHKTWCSKKGHSTSIAMFSLANINKKSNAKSNYPVLHSKALGRSN